VTKCQGHKRQGKTSPGTPEQQLADILASGHRQDQGSRPTASPTRGREQLKARVAFLVVIKVREPHSRQARECTCEGYLTANGPIQERP